MITRRAVLAGAAVALARPAAALAAEDLAPLLTRLIALEQHAALAYRTAGGAFARIAAQEHDHALALAGVLGGLTRPAPAAPTGPGELRGAAARLASGGGAEAAIALERSLLDAYREALRRLEDPGMARTAATVMASHGQHLTVLYERSGRDPMRSGR